MSTSDQYTNADAAEFQADLTAIATDPGLSLDEKIEALGERYQEERDEIIGSGDPATVGEDTDTTGTEGSVSPPVDGMAAPVTQDLDHDGVIDLASYQDPETCQTVRQDNFEDGVTTSSRIDTNGDGRPDTMLVDSDHDGAFDTVLLDSDFNGVTDATLVDTNGDGEFDLYTTDTDGDQDGFATGSDIPEDLGNVDSYVSELSGDAL